MQSAENVNQNNLTISPMKRELILATNTTSQLKTRSPNPDDNDINVSTSSNTDGSQRINIGLNTSLSSLTNYDAKPDAASIYQNSLTVVNHSLSPLSLTNNILTIYLIRYSTSSTMASIYQKLLTVVNSSLSPLSLPNNILTIDLTSYSTTSTINSISQNY